MASQLLKLSMLLMPLTYSSSLDPMITFAPKTENSSDKDFPIVATKGPSLNDSTPGDKAAALIDTSTEELKTSHASTEEPKVTPEQQTRPRSVETQKEASTFPADVMTLGLTTSKDPSPAPFTVNGRLTLPAGLPDTSHDDDETNVHKMTSASHPSGETVGIPTKEATQTSRNIPMTTEKSNQLANRDKQKLILIVVGIVILILILATILFIMVRSKRRRGSQSFNRRGRSSNKQDVWAGQVPELGDGKVTRHPVGMENGTAGNKEEIGKEQEMVTFTSGEKKDDSVVELNEMGKGDALEEKEPLLEDSPHETEEPEEGPVEEKTPALTVEQEQV